MSFKKYDLIKKHFKAKRDEDLFESNSCMDVFKECEYDISITTSKILNVNSCVKSLEKVQSELEYIDSEEYAREVKDSTNGIDDGIYELSDVNESINDLAEAYQHAQTWGDGWKNVALDLFIYMLQNHPDEIDDTGVVKKHINKNLLRSLEGKKKFNL